MTIKESFICPICGNTSSAIIRADALMTDLRVDTFQCTKCDATWRNYMKIAEMSTEIMSRGVNNASEPEVADKCTEACDCECDTYTQDSAE